MSIQVISKTQQAHGEFNNGAIIENKPIGFPQDGGAVSAYSNLFYWANAEAVKDSTIGLHPHKGFEIMSIVLDGTIRHYDDKLNEWLDLKKGDVQIIRAGNGISHSEHMTENSRMFQIWFDPDLNKSLTQPASYGDYRSDDFNTDDTQGYEILHICGPKGKVKMQSDVEIETWTIREYSELDLMFSTEHIYSFYILEGLFTLNKWQLNKDDFTIVKDTSNSSLKGSGKIIVIKNPKNLPYTTYSDRLN